jgi:serine protease
MRVTHPRRSIGLSLCLAALAASGRTDARASFSNHGSCVDLFAPGEGIASTYHQSNTSTAVLSGTSMASPHVAGVVALYLAGNPDASPAQVAQALLGGSNQNRVSDPKGSPNRLLDARFAAAGAPPPPGDPTPDPAPDPDPDPAPPPAPEPDGTPHSGTAQGTLARGQRAYFVPLEVLPGTTVQVQMTGAGDADLYVRFNQRAQLVDRPTQTAYLCVPFRNGSNEVCQMQVPPDAANVNIMVHGFTAASYRLQAQWTSP